MNDKVDSELLQAAKPPPDALDDHADHHELGGRWRLIAFRVFGEHMFVLLLCGEAIQIG